MYTITVHLKGFCFKLQYWLKHINVLSILLLIWLTVSKLENTGSWALYSISRHVIHSPGDPAQTQDHWYTSPNKMLIINKVTITTNDYKLLRQYCHCNTDTESKQNSWQPKKHPPHFLHSCQLSLKIATCKNKHKSNNNITIQRTKLNLTLNNVCFFWH